MSGTQVELEPDSTSEAVDGRRGPPRRWSWRRAAVHLLTTLYVVAVIVALVVSPLAGIALAGVGAVFLLFRQVDLDATTILTLYLLLLALVPASYVVPALGGAGTPAGIVALGVGYWWVLERTAPGTGTPKVPGSAGFQPFRAAVVFYVLTAGSAFVVAFSRPLSSVEVNGAARALMGVAGTAGVALLASDGLRSRARFDVLVNRLLNLGVVMSLVACVQFFTDFDPVAGWRIPGLSANQELASVVERSVVNRVASTTLHPIEFGAVVAILLPIAVHAAMYSPHDRRSWRWIRVGLLGLALPLSVSRTAVVVAVVVVAMMWPAWAWARRIRFLAAAVAFLFVVRAVVSGLLGTIVALFTSFNEDPSTSGRTDDYARVGEFFSERPLLGRGIGTLDPGQYFFLDNQLLMTLVTGGIVGVLGMLVIIGTAAALGRQVYWHALTEEARNLGASLAAAIVGGFIGFLTFDALGFPVFAGVLFLLMGLAGALWRLEVAPNGRTYANPRAARRADLRAEIGVASDRR